MQTKALIVLIGVSILSTYASLHLPKRDMAGSIALRITGGLLTMIAWIVHPIIAVLYTFLLPVLYRWNWLLSVLLFAILLMAWELNVNCNFILGN